MPDDTPPPTDENGNGIEPPARGRGPIDLDAYPSTDRRDELYDLPNVRGHAIGYREVNGERTDEIVVRVIVEEKVPIGDLAQDERVPLTIEGVPTDVVEGHDEPHDAPESDEPQFTIKGSRNASYQPVPGGVSTDSPSPNSTGGIGATGGMYLQTTAGIVGLTASHVFNNNFQYDATGANFRHPYGTSGRTIGTVTHTEPFDSTYFCDTVYWDPATNADITNRVFGLGSITDVISPVLGMRVTFTGWRTGITGGEIVSIDGSATFSSHDGTQRIYGVTEVDQGSNGGNSGSMVGWLAPNGDILGVGLLVGGRLLNNVRTTLIISFDHMAQTPGLGPLDAHTQSSTHPPITSGSRYIEGHVRKTTHNAANGTITVEAYLVNTGGTSGSTVASIYETVNGYNAIASRTITLDPLEATRETWTLSDVHHGTQLVFATNDMVNQFSADDGLLANSDYLGFTAHATHDPTWSIGATVDAPTSTTGVATETAGVTAGSQTTVLPPRAQANVGMPVATTTTTTAPWVEPDYDFDEPIRANPYGGGGYGDFAYGADYNPWVTDLGWEVPLRGDPPEVYHAKVAAIADAIDDRTVLKGPKAERPPSNPDNPGRLYLVTDDGPDNDTNRLYYDRGLDPSDVANDEYGESGFGDTVYGGTTQDESYGWEAVDLDIAIDEDALTDGATDENVTAVWEFLRRLDGSISGDASGAIYATEATAAHDAEAIGETPAEYFGRNEADEQEVEAPWVFERRVRAADTTTVMLGGAITLPGYRDPNA